MKLEKSSFYNLKFEVNINDKFNFVNYSINQ